MDLTDLSSWIGDIGAAAMALPLVLKVAWAAFVIWGVAQLVWYGRVHVDPPPPPPRRSDSSRRIPAAKKTAPVPVLPTGGSPQFLAELGLHSPDGRPTNSVYR